VLSIAEHKARQGVPLTRTAEREEFAIKFVEQDGEPCIYVCRNGVPIAQRGKPGTPHAKTWVPLEPGWVIRDVGDVRNGKMTIEYNDPVLQ
jgi:hypothetical protein